MFYSCPTCLGSSMLVHNKYKLQLLHPFFFFYLLFYCARWFYCTKVTMKNILRKFICVIFVSSFVMIFFIVCNFFQKESWRIVSWPEQGDYLLMLWCGQLPILDYNGGIVLSRKRSGKEMPQSIRDELTKSARSFGLDYDSFCESDNTWCPL